MKYINDGVVAESTGGNGVEAKAMATSQGGEDVVEEMKVSVLHSRVGPQGIQPPPHTSPMEVTQSVLNLGWGKV